MKKTLLIDGHEYSFEQAQKGADQLAITIGGESFEFKRDGRYLVDSQGHRAKVFSIRDHTADRVHLQVASHIFWVSERSPFQYSGQGTTPGYQSPMPGKVLKVLVQEGDNVKEGDPLLILEAMKMEHTIKAQGEGTVKKIHCAEGEQVAAMATLLEL